MSFFFKKNFFKCFLKDWTNPWLPALSPAPPPPPPPVVPVKPKNGKQAISMNQPSSDEKKKRIGRAKKAVLFSKNAARLR